MYSLKDKGLDRVPLYMTLQAVKQNAKCLYDYGKVIVNKCCVKNEDIEAYSWLYIDIDPEHPKTLKQLSHDDDFEVRETAVLNTNYSFWMLKNY